MGLTNQELLAAINSAVKAITVADLQDSILTPQQFDRFVRTMQHKTTILPEARYMDMDSHKVNIDRIAFPGRVLRSGKDDAGDHKVLEEGEFAKPVTATNQLVAQELQAVIGIYDGTMRRNIERGNFENTLVELLGEAAGRDMEEWAILAREDYDKNIDLLLSLTDGWVELSANKVYGGTGGDFDPSHASWPENLFQALLLALPKQYLGNRGDWRIYVSFEIEDAYRDTLKKRGTALGDEAQTKGIDLWYKGIPIRYAPMLERSADIASGGVGRLAMLQLPDNMAWGIFHQVQLEPEREAKKRRTDFVLTFEGDADYEDENASVVALIDADKPVPSP